MYRWNMHLVILSKIVITSRWQNPLSSSTHSSGGAGFGGGESGGRGLGVGGGNGEGGGGKRARRNLAGKVSVLSTTPVVLVVVMVADVNSSEYGNGRHSCPATWMTLDRVSTAKLAPFVRPSTSCAWN